MDPTLIIRICAGGLLVGSAVLCAIRLRHTPTAGRQLPIATIVLIGITVLITGLQFPFPQILSALRRNPEALRAGEWWRMVTPLFVQSDGGMQCLVNGIGALIFCPLAEKLYGKRMLALYVIPGLAGEIVGYIQNSHGAGSSLGIAGVMGAVLGFACRRSPEGSRRLIFPAIGGLFGALVLCALGDRHGPPVLVGALLAEFLNPRIQPVPDRSHLLDVPTATKR